MNKMLFRGFHKNENGTKTIFINGEKITGEWIIGDGIHYPKSFNYIGTCWIDGMRARANDWVPVMPETVGVYTFCNDCNSTKIFTGDIAKEACNGLIGVVEWEDSIATYKLKGYGDGYSIQDSHIEWEIVGNMWENPELIKDGVNV